MKPLPQPTSKEALTLTLGLGVLGLDIMILALSPQSHMAVITLLMTMVLTGSVLFLSYQSFKALKRLKEVSDIDALTGLLNRDAFTNKLELILLDNKTTVALLFMDLNKFKVVNDTLGHRSGDELLKLAGNRIKAALTNKCLLTRLGGDEFAICISEATDRDVEYVARSVSDLFSSPFELNSGMVEVGVSIGIATYPVQAQNSGDLTRYADLAMYESKRTAQPYVFFVNSLAHSSEEELYMGSILRSALDRNQMALEYQPKLDLKTNRVIGAEALIRWDHPILGRVMPDKFIPIAEQQGIINPITDWVLNTALKDLNVARTAGLGLKTISVNISPFSVINGNLLITISKSLAATSVDPSSLIVEVTETSIQHKSEALIKILICLEVLGIGISIDDFGTGQSSLLYLKYLPTTEIKIDKSFIKNICHNSQDHAIVSSLISLAHNIGCTVCAEGVETEETRQALTELGCDTIQGWLISKSAPMNELVKAFGDSK